MSEPKPLPRPLYSAEVAVERACALVGHGVYELGTGDIDTHGDVARDCFGLVCEVFGIRRHRPGFNRGWRDSDGSTPSVCDDLNCDSAVQDASHGQDLFAHELSPRPGMLLISPTIYAPRHEPLMGHVKIVVDVSRSLGLWQPAHPDWSLLDTVECCGPPGRHPGIVAGTGATMVVHDRLCQPHQRTQLISVRP